MGNTCEDCNAGGIGKSSSFMVTIKDEKVLRKMPQASVDEKNKQSALVWQMLPPMSTQLSDPAEGKLAQPASAAEGVAGIATDGRTKARDTGDQTKAGEPKEAPQPTREFLLLAKLGHDFTAKSVASQLLADAALLEANADAGFEIPEIELSYLTLASAANVEEFSWKKVHVEVNPKGPCGCKAKPRQARNKKISMPNYAFRYTGLTLRDLPNGKGTGEFPNGARYDGGWLDGKSSGHGRYCLPKLTKSAVLNSGITSTLREDYAMLQTVHNFDEETNSLSLAVLYDGEWRDAEFFEGNIFVVINGRLATIVHAVNGKRTEVVQTRTVGRDEYKKRSEQLS